MIYFSFFVCVVLPNPRHNYLEESFTRFDWVHSKVSVYQTVDERLFFNYSLS